jgi:hypothetical protein
MQIARKDERNVGEDLPDPRLNPMINPHLAKNLGRWANVYYTTPPGKRKQAVLDLLHELEGAQTPEAELPAPAMAGRAREEPNTQEAPLDPACRDGSPAQQRFCCLCGSPLKSEEKGEAEHQQSAAAPLPAPLPMEGACDDRHMGETHSVQIRMAHEERQALKNTAFVLIISAAIGSLGLWVMRLHHATTEITSRAGPSPQWIASSPNADLLKNEAGRMGLEQSVRDLSKRRSKPAAGKPIGCEGNHPENCSAVDLYRRVMTLADEIDALFIDYDKRVTQLLLDATAHGSDSAQQGQNRSKQANYSAQLWERLRLGSYSSREKYDALKYRAELMRRAMVPKAGGEHLLYTYENPQSCLGLHYIAEDLRRLAAKLPRPKITIPPSNRRAKGNSLSH